MSDITEIKSQWNAILDVLESQNRIAWLAYFDARLVEIRDKSIVLSFADSQKLAGAHDYQMVRKPAHRAALESAILSVTGSSLTVVEQ